MIRSGQLRDRVTITYDSSNTNDPDPTYSTLYSNEPAKITEVGGSETFRGRQLEAHVTAVIEMRYRSDVTSEMRITGASYPYTDRVYNIGAVKIIRQNSRPVALELDCTE